jgi:flavodoxin
MNSVVIYYSYSGNTRKAALVLAGYLREKTEVEIIDLKPQNESRSFLGQCLRALFKQRAKIKTANVDLSYYDLICLGSPVWAFGPAPAMNTYLDQCFGLENKKLVLFTTYGSGVGNERCLNYMQELLARKGAQQFSRFSISQFKADSRDFILDKIKASMRLSP